MSGGDQRSAEAPTVDIHREVFPTRNQTKTLFESAPTSPPSHSTAPFLGAVLVLHEISGLLNTGLDKNSLSILVQVMKESRACSLGHVVHTSDSRPCFQRRHSRSPLNCQPIFCTTEPPTTHFRFVDLL